MRLSGGSVVLVSILIQCLSGEPLKYTSKFRRVRKASASTIVRHVKIRGGQNYYGQDVDGEDGEDPRYSEINEVDGVFDMLRPSQHRNTGLMLSGGGILVTFVGMTLFFNSGLLKLGNLFFLSGLPLIIGPTRFVSFFLKPSRIRATATFLAGVFLVVFAGWPMLGLLVEVSINRSVYISMGSYSELPHSTGFRVSEPVR